MEKEELEKVDEEISILCIRMRKYKELKKARKAGGQSFLECGMILILACLAAMPEVNIITKCCIWVLHLSFCVTQLLTLWRLRKLNAEICKSI